MAILSRIKRVTVGRIESFLTSVENPEVVFPELIKEMEDQIRMATDAEAKVMASVKAAERSLNDAQVKLGKISVGAESALQHDDEGMAREALEAQVKLEQEVARRSEAVDVAKRSHADAHNARIEAQRQLDDLQSKKDEILTRSRVAKSQEKIERSVNGSTKSAGSILDAVARLESTIEEKEAELSVRKDLAGSGANTGSSLERRIDEMNQNQEVENRLAALKAKMKVDA